MHNPGDKKPKKAAAKKKTTAKSTAKKPAAKKRTTARVKSYPSYEQIWTPIGGSGRSPVLGGHDAPPPTNYDLLTAFGDVVYACVNLIAPNVGREADKYKLVVATGPRDAAPKSATKSFDYLTAKRIAEAYPQYARRAVRIDEVADHGVLDLLDRPNPEMSFRTLVEWVVGYLDIVGSAFLKKDHLEVGGRTIVTGLWVLPAQCVNIETDQRTGELLGYKYRAGETEFFYKPDEIIHFKHKNLYDPFTAFGISPVRAVWEGIKLLDKEQRSWEAVLDNMAFPTTLVRPPEGVDTWTPQQAERIEKQLYEKGRWGNNGGVWALSEAMEVNQLSSPPKDLSALQLYQALRGRIAGAMNVPTPLLDLSETSSEAADVAHRNMQRYCLSPRVEMILEVLSHHLCPPRMWLVADSLVSPDKVFELQKIMGLVSSDVITINEGRIGSGYEPKPGLDKLHSEISALGTPSAQTFQTSFQGATTKAIRTKKYKSTPPDPKPLAEALGKVVSKLAVATMAKLVGKDATAARTKSWFPIDTWTAEMKAALTPVLRAYYDEGRAAVLAEVGGGDGIGRHDVQELDRAVERAVLALADSTLSTTTLSVDEAVEATRAAVRSGLAAGEANEKLADRITAIFTDLSDNRVYLIATTESSRAKHNGELIAMKEAGLTARKVWLPDSQACDLCRELAAKGAVGMDEPFAVKGRGPYARIDHPPGHPQCRCTMQYEFDD